MNKAARKVERVRLTSHLQSLVDWRCELTEQIFEYASAQQKLAVTRNHVDRAINVICAELIILSEEIKQ